MNLNMLFTIHVKVFNQLTIVFNNSLLMFVLNGMILFVNNQKFQFGYFLAFFFRHQLFFGIWLCHFVVIHQIVNYQFVLKNLFFIHMNMTYMKKKKFNRMINHMKSQNQLKLNYPTFKNSFYLLYISVDERRYLYIQDLTDYKKTTFFFRFSSSYSMHFLFLQV